jgi:hypothetical protein
LLKNLSSVESCLVLAPESHCALTSGECRQSIVITVKSVLRGTAFRLGCGNGSEIKKKGCSSVLPMTATGTATVRLCLHQNS